MMLAVGCCLYILTGMVLAIPLHLMMAQLPARRQTWTTADVCHGRRTVVVGGELLPDPVLAPAMDLCGGNWITDPEVLPPWIGAATHVVFAWVVAALFPWGTMRARAGSTTRPITNHFKRRPT